MGAGWGGGGRSGGGGTEDGYELTQEKQELLEAESDREYSDMSRQEKDAINAYTAQDSAEINGYLLGISGASIENQRRAEALENAIGKSFVPVDVVVYRGIPTEVLDSMKAAGVNLNKPGTVFENVPFASASLSKVEAMNFAGFDNGKQVYAEIRVNAGTSALYIGKNSVHPYEEEMLFNRGTRFKILEKKNEDKYFDKIVMEVY